MLLVAAVVLGGVPGSFPPAAAQVAPTLVTAASGSVEVGGQIFDNANLLGVSNPTGTITFNLYGPNDATCAGPPIFTSTVPVTGTSVNSQPFTTSAAGTYRWTATYSGDANFLPAGPTPCNDPAEAVVVTAAQTVLSTVASPHSGGVIFDTATLAGGFNPTGTITFDLHGPGDTFCAAPPIFTSTVPVNGNGSYQSGSFSPTVAGTYRWRATYSGDVNNLGEGPTPCLDPAETVDVTSVGPQPGTPTLTTAASPTVPVGGSIFDTAALAGGNNPTGTITFNLYGPDDATCAGAPVFTSTAPVNGAGTYQSGPFTPAAPGTYRWTAAYSGDANNNPAGPTPCTDPAEAVVVTPVAGPAVTLTTAASPTVPVGGSIFDTAALAGGTTPTGTITFNLYGPDDGSCAGPPVFTSTVPVNGAGTYQSGAFTPTAPGTYRWTAAYSGDANNNPAGPTPCTDPAEAVVVTPVVAPGLTLTTTASPSVAVGGQVFDTATLSGGTNPTGTITFNLFSPSDATCTGPPVFTSTVPVNGAGTYQSGSFTPTAPGTYRWTAAYSGDANNVPGSTPCNDPAEQVVVTPVSGPTASITVAKSADPTTRPAPGGTFTFGVVVTNTGGTPVTITGITDDVHGDLAGRGSCAAGAVLAAGGGQYACSFSAELTGVAGASQTDTVTVTASVPGSTPVTASGSATVSITTPTPPPTPPPSISVDQEADSLTRPAPGGTFLSSVSVTNTSSQPLTLVSLVDDDLNGKGTCRLPQPLQPGGTYSCTFPIEFFGNAGDSRTFTTTATAVDAFGRQAVATDSITLTLTAPVVPPPPPPPPPPPRLVPPAPPPPRAPVVATPVQAAAADLTATTFAAPLAVAAAAAAVPSPAPPRAALLPRTGSDPVGNLRLALALVVGGLTALVVGSARRPATVARWLRRRR